LCTNEDQQGWNDIENEAALCFNSIGNYMKTVIESLLYNPLVT